MEPESDWEELVAKANSVVANQVDSVFCDKVADNLALGMEFKVI